MEARVVEFSEVLRQNGMRVSIAESCDAVRAAGEAGLGDRALFQAVLRSTLCKRQADVETFDRAFDFFFTGAARTFEALDKSLADRIAQEGLLEGDELKMIVWMLGHLGPGLHPLTQAALQGDRGRMAQLFRGASLQLDFSKLQSGLQKGFFARRLALGAGSEGMRADLKSLERELTDRGLSGAGLEIVSKHLGEALRGVEEAARKELERQLGARLKAYEGGLNAKAFHTLSRLELQQAQAAVRALATRLKTRLVRRQKSRRKGTLDPRKTLRQNLAAGGVPMQPIFRTKRPQRPDVVVLCDVSDSVRNASRMMLLFMHTLQALFTRVRSFVFVSEVGEITRYFKEALPEDALDVAAAERVISLASNSNYGHALAAFAKGHLGSITRRTTVLVIGDGRNNYNAANVWALEDVKRKAKRVIWICSEPRANWGFGDSEMLNYARACTAVVTVQSLGDLERAAHDLIPQ